MNTIQICMGSACHQYGVYHVLPLLQRLLAEHDLAQQVELKGAFCLGPCTSGIVLKFDERLILNVDADNIATRFYEDILPDLKAAQGGPHGR